MQWRAIKNDTLKYGPPAEMYNADPYNAYIFISFVLNKKKSICIEINVTLWNVHNGFDGG